jgi:hypothetical protein
MKSVASGRFSAMNGAVARAARRTAVALLLVAIVGTALAACSDGGHERSARAFCATLTSEKQRYLEDYDSTGQDPLDSLVKGLGSIGEIPVIFDKLDKVAPPEIEPDVAATRDAFQHQIDSIGDAASNPLGALAAGIVSGLVANGPFTRVSEYITEHCPGQGGSVGGDAVRTTTSSTTALSPASAGWGYVRHDEDCTVIGGRAFVTFSSTTTGSDATPVVPSSGSRALVLPEIPTSPDPLFVALNSRGKSSTSGSMDDISADPSGETESTNDPLLGVGADGTPWAIYSSTTTVAGKGLDPDRTMHPITAFRLDTQGRAWQVDGLLGATQPVDPNVEVALFQPQAIAGSVVVGELSGMGLGRQLVALRLSDGSVAWRRPLENPLHPGDDLNWKAADGALFVDVPDPGGSGFSTRTEVDDPNTGSARGTVDFYLYDSTILGLPSRDRWVLGDSEHLVVIDGRGAVVTRRDGIEGDPLVDSRSGIVAVGFNDGHYEGIDSGDGSSAWTLDGGLVRNTGLGLTGAGEGYFSGEADSDQVVLDAATGTQVWTGMLTASIPFGEVVGDRLVTCQGTADDALSAGSAVISIPVTATPIGLDHDRPIYPDTTDRSG